MSTLLAIKGPRCGARFPLGEKTTLGRAPECTIELPDSAVSRVHAEIVHKRKNYTLSDLESKNGTTVNGKKITAHILLRNDEIRIGSSVLLFDPDFDVQNARYSGSSVYVSSPHDETLEVKAASTIDTTPPLDDRGIALVGQLADLFTSTTRELPELLNSLLHRLMHLFHAERGFVMLWDPVLKELQPVVAISPDEKQIAVSRKVITTTFFEKTALLSSGGEGDFRYAEEGAIGEPRSSISAPLLLKGEALGLIYIDREGADRYDLKALGLLQAVGRLVVFSIDQSRYFERSLLKARTVREGELLGASPEITAIRAEIERLADVDSSVLIMGETGTGKELIARALHEYGPRREYPFIVVNCTAVPDTLFESELFGYEKGAFTGATSLHRGKIEIAHGGTLFLDEIGDLKPLLQPKLLRFLQEKNFYRVGGTRSIRVDVRIIAATNADLMQLVREGKFREDLYYRLSVITIKAPPLREHKSDIRLIAEHYTKVYAHKLKKPIFGISDDAIIKLEKYSWPGNVRELMNAIERTVILCTSKILKPQHFILKPVASAAPQKPARISKPRPLADVEKEHISSVLKQCGWNQVKAARILGIHRNTLRKKITEYSL